MTNLKEQELKIPCDGIELNGTLYLSNDDGHGFVLFAHGSGSGRKSPRNIFVAKRLLDAGLNSLLFDLLTEKEEILEERTRHLRFDIALLSRRLRLVTLWMMQRPRTKDLPFGYFGASTGAGAALVAAAALGDGIKAIVSRGGRPDLAERDLPRVTAPTLLIVGGNDPMTIELNRKAMVQMKPGLSQIKIVPGATHLFEEKGTLEEVADLATDWFCAHLAISGHEKYNLAQNDSDFP